MENINRELNNDSEVKHADYIYIVSDGLMIIGMNAELDHHLAEEMKGVIDDVIDKRGVDNIIFDFSRVSFMDSSGIGLIMGRYKKINEKGKIYVVGVNESISRIMLISGLHKLVRICRDRKSAVNEIKGENR